MVSVGWQIPFLNLLATVVKIVFKQSALDITVKKLPDPPRFKSNLFRETGVSCKNIARRTLALLL